ncbi:MAG: hypothetical protein KGN80_11015, partial [Acidobacteriota bacterium]|nr:hypothetical protein [Acidobacteriota bacterium]
MRVLLLALGFTALLGAQPASLPFPKLGLESSSIPVHTRDFVSGNLVLSLQEGQLARILNQGRPVGFYYKGKGWFRYTSRDRMEFASFSHNLDKNANLKPVVTDKSATLQEGLTELIVMDPSQCGELPQGSAPDDLRTAFAALHDPMATSITPRLEQLVALQQTNSPQAHVEWTLV